MGVPGLWDVLRPAGQTRSLTHLSVVDGFERNEGNLRGYRVGIDASIWLFHSEWGREGENPQLRTIFFRCVKLMNSPFLPLFVFDGPGRPSEKRGKKINKSKPHALVEGTKRLIVALGFEWRTAPGEAEAELAYLNRIGVIDAIISDDVDNFLFGATVVIRNSSSTLSGNKSHANVNAAGKKDNLHTTIYRASDILVHPSVRIDQGGLILFALLSGGDYHSGLKGCGRNIARAIAKCGLGKSLINAARNLPRDDLVHNFLPAWRDELRQELRTDSRGFIGRKCIALAKNVSDDFPDVDILLCYTNPLTSELAPRGRNKDAIVWDREPSPAEIAAVCEQFFEWGYREKMLYRFRSILWPALVCRILRRATLVEERDVVHTTPQKKRNTADEDPISIGTPSKMIARHFTRITLTDDRAVPSAGDRGERLIIKIHSERTHASTDGLLEYRLEINPTQLVRLCLAGIKGTRPKPENDAEYTETDVSEPGNKTASSDPHKHVRVWMPASMVNLAEPGLVKQWEDRQRKKLGAKSRKGKAKARDIEKQKQKKKAITREDPSSDEMPSPSLWASNFDQRRARSKISAGASVTEEGEESDSSSLSRPTKITSGPKTANRDQGSKPNIDQTRPGVVNKGVNAIPCKKPADLRGFYPATKSSQKITVKRTETTRALLSAEASRSNCQRQSRHTERSESDYEQSHLTQMQSKPPQTVLDRLLSISPQKTHGRPISTANPIRLQRPSSFDLSSDSGSEHPLVSNIVKPSIQTSLQPRLDAARTSGSCGSRPRSLSSARQGGGSDDRPASPSPLGHKSQPSQPQLVSLARSDVIEITSDSDTGVRPKPTPLWLARQRALAGDAKINVRNGPARKPAMSKHVYATVDGTVIDLTEE